MRRWAIGVPLLHALWALPALAQAPPDTARIRMDALIVESTRAGRLPEDEPLRVEVVGREEIEEKLLMTPGSIAMLLNEMGGVRVQQTAPAFGGAAVRIQGMRGQYAQILVDGLPLHGEATGLGPLQIPPMDLRQVELIKGPASALYGPAALGGVVNLISRRPDGERELLVNATTRGGLDAVAWLASDEAGSMGWTLVAGGHEQPSVDVSGDGWSDMPAHRRATVRPRVFASSGTSTVMLTAGAVAEQRTGGFQTASTGIDALDTRRADAGVVAATWWGARRVTLRGAWVEQRNDRVFAGRPERDGHSSLFGEAAVAGVLGGQTWVAGAALQRESYRHRDVAGVDETIVAPGLFLQQEWSPGEWLAVSASGRVDMPTGHGALFSPRLAVLLRPDDWSVRVSAGGGHHLPGYWIEEVEAVGLGAVARDPLDVERATSYSIDLGREIGDVAVNVTGFTSRIRDAVALRGAGTASARVTNVAGVTRTHGAELLLNAEFEPIHAIASWTWLRASEPDPDGAGRREVPLTPRHAGGVVLMWEMDDEVGRVGFETYYTGEQSLHDSPYRERSRPYVVFGVLAERRWGPARLFVNFENIGGVRQTRWDPLLLPQPAADGRRTTDAWAPLDGRVVNGGVRLDF